MAQSDDYLLSSHANCPKFDELHAQVLEGQAMKSLYLKNQELFRYTVLYLVLYLLPGTVPVPGPVQKVISMKNLG